MANPVRVIFFAFFVAVTGFMFLQHFMLSVQISDDPVAQTAVLVFGLLVIATFFSAQILLYRYFVVIDAGNGMQAAAVAAMEEFSNFTLRVATLTLFLAMAVFKVFMSTNGGSGIGVKVIGGGAGVDLETRRSFNSTPCFVFGLPNTPCCMEYCIPGALYRHAQMHFPYAILLFRNSSTN